MKAFFITLCLALVGCDQLSPEKTVQSKEVAPRYQMAVDSEGNAWRLDTVSGEIKRCWQGSPGSANYPPSCYTADQK